MVRILLLILVCTTAGCNFHQKQIPADYKKYSFDTSVIGKLPLYDSLAVSILESYPLFQNLINKDASYRAYRYMPLSDDKEIFKKLPGKGTEKISQYINRLGKDFIYGFDLFKDSTIKIYVRKSYSNQLRVDVRENLSYYPPGNNIRRRDPPARDTVLNRNWLYWISFDERGIF